MKKLLEWAILPPTPLKNVQKMCGPPLTEAAFVFLTNYMILEVHLNYFLIFFAFSFQDCRGCTVTILIFVKVTCTQ